MFQNFMKKLVAITLSAAILFVPMSNVHAAGTTITSGLSTYELSNKPVAAFDCVQNYNGYHYVLYIVPTDTTIDTLNGTQFSYNRYFTASEDGQIYQEDFDTSDIAYTDYFYGMFWLMIMDPTILEDGYLSFAELYHADVPGLDTLYIMPLTYDYDTVEWTMENNADTINWIINKYAVADTVATFITVDEGIKINATLE